MGDGPDGNPITASTEGLRCCVVDFLTSVAGSESGVRCATLGSKALAPRGGPRVGMGRCQPQRPNLLDLQRSSWR